MVELQDVSFRYKGKARPVFQGLSLSLSGNKVYGLLGENGTGKSTLLSLISGLLRPTSGRVTVHCPSAQTPSARRPEFLREMFLLPEEFEFPSLKLDAYVRINAPFYPRFSDEQFTHYLAAFGLTRDVHLGALSMGERKKVFIAFALAANTRLLLMDEPTNGLDIPSKSQFRSVVAQCMTDERTVVISTHQVHDVEQLLDHVIILSHSRLDASPLLLDAPMDTIARSYVFETRPAGTDTSDALYAEPSVQGLSVIRPREEDEAETSVNLEVLFNAVIGPTPLPLPCREESEQGTANGDEDVASAPIRLEGQTQTIPLPTKEGAGGGSFLSLLRYLHCTYRRLPWLVLIAVVALIILMLSIDRAFQPTADYFFFSKHEMGFDLKVMYRQTFIIRDFGIIICLLLLLCCVLPYAGLGKKTARTTWLMLPASNLCKTCVRVIGLFVVWLLAATVGVAIADGLRMLISLMTNPEMAQPAFGSYLDMMANTFNPVNLKTPWETGFYTFIFAFLMLCSALFRRAQWAWGILCLIVFRLGVGIMGSYVMPVFGIDTSAEWEPLWFGFCTLMTPVCIWLAHRIFCRWQLDGWRFTNL